jgi:hypothetical protein
VSSLDHALHERPEGERVTDGDKVHSPAKERETHRGAVHEHATELVRLEAVEARPQAVVGRQRRLCLEPEQMLDGLSHRLVDAGEKQLALEKRSVELALGDGLISRRR